MSSLAQRDLGTLLLFVCRSAYGVQRYYPANGAAEALCKVCKVYSLLESSVILLAEAGFSIRDVSPRFGDESTNTIKPGN